MVRFERILGGLQNTGRLVVSNNLVKTLPLAAIQRRARVAQQGLGGPGSNVPVERSEWLRICSAVYSESS
jgi:hypothetical protein